MADKLKGQTLIFNNSPFIISYATVSGPEEGKGPFASSIDKICTDPKCGKDTWEKGEKSMVKDAISLAMKKFSIAPKDIDLMVGGDLLNQIAISNFIARDYKLPYLGIYGACSSLIEALIFASISMDGGFADSVLNFSSSHYQTAERQYRTPLEYGAQYPPYKQYTVTGAGAYILGWINGHVKITAATIGKVIDLKISDPNDMGSAMAPAAADTILQHLNDTNRNVSDFDLIITGDLGKTGLKNLRSLLKEKNLELGNKLSDCGAIIFKQDAKYGSGGSGCAASSIILGSNIIPALKNNKYKRVLLIGTGALLSPITILQKESIPGIAHAVLIEKIN